MERGITDRVHVPAGDGGVAARGPDEGRHRRVYPELVVHLVFHDLTEVTLGCDSHVGRSLGHLAAWITEQ